MHLGRLEETALIEPALHFVPQVKNPWNWSGDVICEGERHRAQEEGTGLSRWYKWAQFAISSGTIVNESLNLSTRDNQELREWFLQSKSYSQNESLGAAWWTVLSCSAGGYRNTVILNASYTSETAIFKEMVGIEVKDCKMFYWHGKIHFKCF